jgi:predicted phosphate transport protein (TIGR00153 family)
MPPFGFSLIPKNGRFYDLFVDLSQLLIQTSDAMCDLMNEYTDTERKAARVFELESESDGVTHSIYTLMNQTFLTPIDREDIAALAQRMDDVVDYVEATTTSLTMYGIVSVTPAAAQLAALIRLQCMEIARAIEVLRSGRKLNDIIAIVHEINRLENQGDVLFVRAMADLFEGDLPATEIIKWREVYDELENALDSCENVSHVLESIVVKHG